MELRGSRAILRVAAEVQADRLAEAVQAALLEQSTVSGLDRAALQC